MSIDDGFCSGPKDEGASRIDLKTQPKELLYVSRHQTRKHLFLASGVSQPIKNLVSGQVLVLEILDLGSILCYAKMF